MPPADRKTTPLRDLTTYGRGCAVRHPDFDYASEATVHTTLRADRDSPFSEHRCATMVCASVERSCELCGYDLFGYTLMPNHLHVLCSLGNRGVSHGDWLRRFKSFTTNQFVKLGGDSPLWQTSGYDHVCREEETWESVLAYIANNPVRAGLIECWQDWRWTRVFIEI